MQETYPAGADGSQLDNPQSKTSPMVLPSILLSTADEPSSESIQGSLAIEINLLTPQQNERQLSELTPKSENSLFLSPCHEGHLKCVSVSPPQLELDKERSESPGLLTSGRWSDDSPSLSPLYDNDGDWPISLVQTQEGSEEASGSTMLTVGDLADSINKIKRRLSTSSAGSHRRSNSEDVVVKLLIEEEKARRGMEDLIGKLRELLKNEEGYKQLLSKRGTDAQALVDLFQDLLDAPESMNPTLRRQLIVALQRLCKAANVYPRSYELPEIPFSEQGFVGGGGFGDIYRCQQQQQAVVCVKVIRLHLASLSDQFMKNFVREAILWGQLFHPNVLPFHGFFRHHSRPCLVSPWMNNGPVTDYLKHHPHVDRYHLVSDITEGLSYLHSWDIVHGDLKGVNILVDDCGRARLADFGLSSIFDTSIPHWTSYSTVASKGGSVRWQAPELFDFDSTDDKDVYNTSASDIYAWACVCYEIFTGRLPFFEITKDANVTHKIKTVGLRPSRPPKDSPAWLSRGLNNHFWGVMEACWAEKPLHRPLIDQLLPILRAKVSSDPRPPAQFPRITSEYRRAKRAKPNFPSLHELEHLISQPQGEDTSTTPVGSPSPLDDFRMVEVRESVKRNRDPEEEDPIMQEKSRKRPRISSHT